MRELRDTIDGVPIPFIWSMDEIDHSERADSHRQTVYVPGDLIADQVPFPVDRAAEPITLVNLMTHGIQTQSRMKWLNSAISGTCFLVSGSR
jgi:hypothetical protein